MAIWNAEIDRNADNWPDNWYQWTASGKQAVTWANKGLKAEEITLGKKSLRVDSPGEDVILGINRNTPYDPKKAYFVSGYVETSNAKGKAGIQATGYDANGNITQRIRSNEISGTQGSTRLHVALEPGAFPEGTVSFRIRGYVFNIGGQYDGTYWFDGFQIEEEFYGGYNLVENSGFERANASNKTIPDGWYMTATTDDNDGIDTEEKHTGKSSVKIEGGEKVYKSVYQDINVIGGVGATFTVSSFSKVDRPNPKGGIYGYIIKTYQGTTEQETFTYHFNKNKSHDWEHKAAEIKTTKSFDKIRVHFEYADQTGSAWFDTVKVIPGSIQTQYTYDSKGNYVTKTTDPLGRVTENTYDAAGNETSEKVGSDTTLFGYDPLDRLAQITGANSGVTKYTYDANGNKTKITNARGKETRYEYNEIDEVTKVTDPLNKSTHYDYDLHGNQTKVTYPNGNKVEYGYNAVDRNTSISHNGTKRYSFEYDPNGNVTKETDHNGNEVTAYTYDEDNKLKTVSRGSSNTTDYTYDKNGNITEQAYTAGSTIFKHTFAYNALDQLIRVTEDGKSRAWFTYDEGDRIASRKNGDGTVTLFRYNGAGDLVEQIILDKQGELLDKFTYSYDNKGNITSIKSAAGTTQYVYDSLDQLTKEIRPDGTIYEYTYDATGNRLTQKVTKGSDIKTTTYTYDDADQLTAVGGRSQTYDDNGNLTNDGERTFVYDAENRLTAVKDKEGNSIASFTYRADGMRKTMTTGSKTITFHYDEDNNVTHETDGNNQVIASYTYADDQPISMTRGGKTYYYQTNYRGDVVALTDSAGAVVATYEYDAYGNLLKETGNVENPYRYAGYRYDGETGLYYLQSRYYNPETGRFLTRDLIEGDEENPLSFNKYAYAENNPTGKIDPDGNRAFWFGSVSRSGSNIRIYIRKWVVKTYQYMGNGVLLFSTGVAAAVGGLLTFAFNDIVGSKIGRKGTRITLRGKFVNRYVYKRSIKRTRRGIIRINSRVKRRTWRATGFSVAKWN